MLKCVGITGTLMRYDKCRNFSRSTINRLWGGLGVKHSSSSSSVAVTSPAVRINKALSRDIPQVLKLFRKSFAKNEPLVEGLQMPTENYSPALQELLRNQLEQGMSLVAIPQKFNTGSPIFGLIVNTKCCSWDTEFLNKYTACIRCPKTSDLINLWALFVNESKVHKKFNIDCLFQINHVIINEESSLEHSPKLDKSSLSKILVSMSLQLAESRGFEAACLISTSQHIADVASATGMELVWEYPFQKLLNSDLNPIVKWKEPDTHVKVFARKF